MWAVFQRYRGLREKAGYRYDWDDLASAVRQELSTDNRDWWYRHVVIDEAQDFSPEMLRSLAAGIRPGGSLTLFADVAQQIYGVRLSWKDAGLLPPKVYTFQDNYRNSLPIASLAFALARMPFFHDEPDIVLPKTARAAGPPPALVRFTDEAAEQAFLLDTASQLGRTQRVAVFVRTRDEVLSFLAQLRKSANLRSDELHPDRGSWFWEPGVLVGTYQAAKGLEFDAVIMPCCSTARWPDPKRIQQLGADDAGAEDSRLLYVGITRARNRLVISYTGKCTELLPIDATLYDHEEQIGS